MHLMSERGREVGVRGCVCERGGGVEGECIREREGGRYRESV